MKFISRHIIIQFLKTKDKNIVKVAIEKWHNLEGTPIRKTADILSESIKARRSAPSFWTTEGRNYQLWFLYPVILSFNNKREIKTFSDKRNEENLLSEKSPVKNGWGGNMAKESK